MPWLKSNENDTSNWKRIFLKRALISGLFFIVESALVFALFFLYSLNWEAFRIFLSINIFVYLVAIIMLAMYTQSENLETITSTKLLETLEKERTDNQESKRDMNQYFLTWVHQMKTPITAAQLLAKQNSELPAIQALREELIHIENYTDMALSYVKLADFDADMVLQAVSLDALVRPLLKKYAIFFFRQKNTLHYSPLEQSVITDARWASVLVEQILSNALKYTQNGDISIVYNDYSKSLEITDTGIGISQADLPKIFEKGYSGLNGRLNAKSSGLGLFLAQKIASKLQVKISVSSSIGQGSTFSLRFPQSE